jgi:steroid delta-isomerase-like uncharacterized protein
MRKKEILQRFIDDIWNHKRLDKVEHYVNDQYTIHLDTADPWEGKILSHQDFKERLQFSFSSFSDIHFEITSSIEEESHVAITWILTGTNDGYIGNLPPTGKSIRTTGLTIYHFQDDLICGHTQIFDRATVAKQLGF